MRRPSGRGPFRPGLGGIPPYFAGREEEQSLFRDFFGSLAQGEPPATVVVLYGPRGNGKTALLRWAEREANSREGLEAEWLTAADIPTAAETASQLRVTSLLQRLTPQSVSVAGVSVGMRNPDGPARLARALAERANSRPLLLLLDEAHTLTPEAGHLLLNAAPEAGAVSPFLLVLAGTPDLPARLSEMSASFWGRAEKVRLGRLEDGPTAEAIRRPLRAEGITLDEDALASIVRESHGYPYFTQLWGGAVWKALRRASGSGNRVTPEVLAAASSAFEEKRNDYYLDRFYELQKRDLLEAARIVAEAFRHRSRLDDREYRAAVRAAGSEDSGPGAPEAGVALEHLGFVWRAKGLPGWEPGIPSLMDYIREYAPAPNRS